ncbi:VTT domain-containing protein [Paenibacillus sediminis]|uniref:TVP38/TMEM64 family membrane protein n=1 Tax=Paenibacillus sediminis TaxID=664909 RepID=A0ABS4GZB6_9BACL|nr:VTT domain-containing protein [Paenibacillus sediminis]MBP1935608.1 putative membrane protein YdjX (TVP38/TMEM64 family) [Paenibacillus sediminis]
MKKILFVLLYLIVFITAIMYRDHIFIWLKHNDSFFIVIVLAVLLALFPIVPYKIVIAALGYTFGAVWGGFICWMAATVASVVMYAGASYVFREQGRRYLSKIKTLDTFTAYIEKRPFETIVLVRIIPIVPALAVNVYAGVAAIPFWTYTLASGIGKIPGIAVYALMGETLKHKPLSALIIWLIYLLFVIVVLYAYKLLARHHKEI